MLDRADRSHNIDRMFRTGGIVRLPCAKGWRPAMTLVEMAVAVLLIGAALFLLVGWTRNLQSDARRTLAIRLLAELDKALAQYHRANERFPNAPQPDAAARVTVALLDFERTRQTLDALPDSVWRGPGHRILVDPWGTPLQYFSETGQSRYILANNGRPVFVSAGPDRDFGDDDVSKIGDNLRSDDPGPAGFRLDHIMRDSLKEEEAESGEKDN
jgi:type II secretory pathway pseudopilin PulG